MELSAILTMLRRWSPTLIASAVVAGVVAYFMASTIAPTYSAEARVLVGPINTDSGTLGASQELVQTYGSLVTSDRVLAHVIDELGLNLSASELREAVGARAESVTRVLAITAAAGDAQEAAAIANTVADGLDLFASEGQTRPEGEVTLISRAQPNPGSAQPSIPLIVVLAAASGLISSLAAVLLIDYFSDSVSSRQDLQRLAGAPVLASVAPRRFIRRRRRPLIVESEPDSRASLAYRLMGAHVTAEGEKRTLRSLVVLGAEGREGAGEVAANLAAALVRAGRRVRLVDANDEDHEVTHLFGLRATRQLSELAGKDASAETMSVRVMPGVDVLPVPPGRDPRLSDITHVRAAMQQLHVGTDIVILTTAPVHRSETALLWARESDGAILVAKRDATKRDAVTISAESLRVIGTPLIGAMLHAVWRRPVAADIVTEPGARPSTLGPSAAAASDSPTADGGSTAEDRSVRTT